MQRRHNRLTPYEARQAIYFDYEGRKNKDPVLFGYYEGGDRVATIEDVHQAVVDEAFRPVAHATGLITHLAETSLAALAMAALDGHRSIVAWSDHELNLAKRLLAGFPKLQHFERHYVNGLDVARHWRNARHAEWNFERRNGTRYRLADFLTVTGYRLPPRTRLRRVKPGSG